MQLASILFLLRPTKKSITEVGIFKILYMSNIRVGANTIRARAGAASCHGLGFT
jgi:hypothetical protein